MGGWFGDVCERVGEQKGVWSSPRTCECAQKRVQDVENGQKGQKWVKVGGKWVWGSKTSGGFLKRLTVGIGG